MRAWKYPIFMLFGFGISYLGNWIYLIALNISILHLTSSAAAVAGLYMIRPIATLMTNTWSGSVIDRVNKRKIMITVDVIRGILVFFIPFIDSIWLIYILLLLANIAGAFFGPSSAVYITRLIPAENRTRFNSIMSMTSSGAFLLGPAVAGVLIMQVGTTLCIMLNALSFLICALFIYLLPNVDEGQAQGRKRSPITLNTLLEDWKVVRIFTTGAKYFISIYLLFQGATLIGFALDSQEITYIKQHLMLSDRDYGMMVSITGLGALIGGLVATIVAKRIGLRLFIGAGVVLSSLGYLGFYSSINLLTATIAFVLLGFFMAFANSGYATFFQNHVPVEIMGRFGSFADMVQGIIQIGLTLLLGIAAEWFSLQAVCLIAASVGVLLAMSLLVRIYVPSKLALETSQEYDLQNGK